MLPVQSDSDSVSSMSDVGQSVKQQRGDMRLTHDPRKLRRHRIERGLSVTEAAEKAGYSKAHISMLESGSHHSASPQCLRELAKVYRCRIADLLPDEGASGNGHAA